MTRIIAGEWGGRRLATPPGDGTRPTSDRVRESLFASLTSSLGGFDGVRVLDLFAGTGALALESLSRGAAQADLVESDPRVVKTIQRNVADLDASATVHRLTAERFVARSTGGPWDLVFVDPPYALETSAVAALLTGLRARLGEDALIVVERSSRDPFTWPKEFTALRDKAYGETQLWYGR